MFSAGETALFLAGKRVGTLNKEETFAFNAVQNELRLAAYSVEKNGETCTLSIKRNTPKKNFTLGKDGRTYFALNVTLSAGLLDYSKATDVTQSTDAGDVPDGVFDAAEKRLAAQIDTVFEKCRNANCDLFGVLEHLQKKENKRYEELKNHALEQTVLKIDVRFQNVR